MTDSISSYQAILFDLDGTLLDTANDLGAALNHVLTLHGMATVNEASFRPQASNGALGLLTLGFGDQLSTFDSKALRQTFLHYYHENIAKHTCMYDGVEQLLSQLNLANIPWGIVTNKPIALTLRLLEHFPLLAASKVIVGGDSLTERKPHPAPLLYASEQLEVSANKTIYLGDAERDIVAGNAANMYTVIAKWGYITEQEPLELWQADYVAQHPQLVGELIL